MNITQAIGVVKDWMAGKPAVARSPKWAKVEREHLAAHPACVICGTTTRARQVHHRIPFHFVIALGRPDLELDERNLHTMCVDSENQHHILIGHLDDYESWNPDLQKWIIKCHGWMVLLNGLTSAGIRNMPSWIEAVAKRPKHLGDMTAAERVELRARMDHEMPLR